MTSIVRHITFDCADPHEPYDLARFWSQVLGQPVDPIDEPGDDEVALEVPAGQPTLLFVRVPEKKSLKNRVHLDLEPDRPRDEEVERVSALGATIVDDRRKPNGRGWVVFADPAGNEFCIEGSAAERAAAEREYEAAKAAENEGAAQG
ncbi:VOC family protein [Streptomyces lunaelactis]|uniref:VOC family protein n=1 Tax=Streptomyces lunaelactis TaxID=1535768 RepID=UPI001584E626|nr:VOC family protein [Streptomyces lunaelactis]NUK00932.1 VOC family protein [Streptomyces lunaelactis]NUK13776.1 VOC family protein [Streptomyces lunaelactis]NUK21583.1 VOC family protein [Streptomyces lunaelactis]NUK32418.1 VOC family protein [Streptomyces lunaelactis]NUK39435.1 VOC family protein [Streptomyces lunaelactis]